MRGQRQAPAVYTSGKDPVPIVQEAGWVPGPVWTVAENLAPPPGFYTRIVHHVASCYTDWATRPTYDLNCSPNIMRVIKSRRIRWTGHVARMGERRSRCRVLVGRPEWKRTVARHRIRWGDNIKLNFEEVGWRGMDWIDLAQDKDGCKALFIAVVNLRFPQNSGNW
jgi:hypothetical protein